MNKKKLIWQIPFLALLIIGTVVILKKQPPFRTNEGLVFGTVYKITYHQAHPHFPILIYYLPCSATTPANSGSTMIRPQYSQTMIFLRERISNCF